MDPDSSFILILIVLLALIYLIDRAHKSSDVDIEILPDEPDEPDIESDDPPPWTVIGTFSDGRKVRFNDDISNDVLCPYCKIWVRTPVDGDSTGWICSKCRTPHHLKCRKQYRQCGNITCYK